MSVLSKLSGALGRNNDEANKDLGMELVRNRDQAGIREIIENLKNKDKRIQVDCLSVLEQVGKLAPELMENAVDNLMALALGRNNRLIWAAMIDLALIADRKPKEIFERFDDLMKVCEAGSVITQDNGIKIFAKVASTDTGRDVIWPFLMEQLKTCRPKSVAQYAESTYVAVTDKNREEFRAVLNPRLISLSEAQKKRVMKLLR